MSVSRAGVRIAIRNVSRHRRRSALLGGTIAFSVMIVTVVQSFTAGLIATAERRVTDMLGGHIYLQGQEVDPSGRLVSLVSDRTVLDEALAREAARVDAVHYRSSAFGEMIFVSRARTVSLTGVDWDREPRLVGSLDLVDGDIASIEDRRSILLPEPLADALGVRVGETVLVRLTGVTGRRNVGEFTVGGLLRDAELIDMDTVYADRAYVNDLVGLPPEGFREVVVSVRDASMSSTVAGEIESFLASRELVAADRPSVFGEQADAIEQSGAGPGTAFGGLSSMAGLTVDEAERWEGTRFSITTIEDVMAPLVAIMSILDRASFGLFVTLLGISMVGLLNTFRMVLIERTAEIGTMRAIGMQRHEVRDLFLLEAAVLALGGAVVGLLLALVAGAVGSMIRIDVETPIVMFLDGTTFAFVVEPARIGVTLAALAAITLLSAYLPARRAASMRPADALRANN